MVCRQGYGIQCSVRKAAHLTHANSEKGADVSLKYFGCMREEEP